MNLSIRTLAVICLFLFDSYAIFNVFAVPPDTNVWCCEMPMPNPECFGDPCDLDPNNVSCPSNYFPYSSGDCTGDYPAQCKSKVSAVFYKYNCKTKEWSFQEP